MPRPLNPLHLALLAGTFPLFLGVLLTDVAYFNTYEVQWKNFASWLLVGALVYCGLTALWALVSLGRAGWGVRGRVVYLLLLLMAFVMGLINAFVHASDAWGSMPQALILSVIVALLMLAALVMGLLESRRVVVAEAP